MGIAANQQEYNKENGIFFGGASLKTGNASTLKNKSLFFFALSILLTLIAAAAVLYEFANNHPPVLPYDAIGEALILEGKGDAAPGSNGFSTFSSVFLVGSLTLLLCTLIGGMLFFKRNILIPLETTRDIVQRMAEGHLDKAIRIRSDNEIGQVAEGINSLAINVQEVLLYVWNHTQQNVVLLDRISKQLQAPPDNALPSSILKEAVDQVSLKNEELKDIVTAFNYFEVKLEHEKMVSDPLDETIKSEA